MMVAKFTATAFEDDPLASQQGGIIISTMHLPAFNSTDFDNGSPPGMTSDTSPLPSRPLPPPFAVSDFAMDTPPSSTVQAIHFNALILTTFCEPVPRFTLLLLPCMSGHFNIAEFNDASGPVTTLPTAFTMSNFKDLSAAGPGASSGSSTTLHVQSFSIVDFSNMPSPVTPLAQLPVCL